MSKKSDTIENKGYPKPPNNPSSSPARGTPKKIWTKEGHAELLKLGFNPIEEMVNLYNSLEEEYNGGGKNASSHIWCSNTKSTQQSILFALLPYFAHKVEVSREKEIQALQRPPVKIVLKGQTEYEEFDSLDQKPATVLKAVNSKED